MPPDSARSWESDIQAPDRTPAVITITIQGYLTLKDSLGKRRVSLPSGTSLQDCLSGLQQDLGGPYGWENYRDAGELREHMIVLLNGVHCRHLPEGLGTILKDGDQIAIFPPVAGG